MWNFSFVELVLRDWPAEIRETVADISLAQLVFANARIGFGKTISDFYRGQKRQFGEFGKGFVKSF